MRRTPTAKQIGLALAGAAVLALTYLSVFRPSGGSGEPIEAPAVRPKETPGLEVVLPASSLVSRFTSRAGSMTYLQAVRILGGLPDSLDHTEQATLVRFLQAGMPGLDRLPSGEYDHVANDLMMAGLRQSDLGPDFIQVLGSIAADSGEKAVVRDYAIQAIGRWLNDRSKVGQEPEYIGVALAALLATASRPGWISAGTAVIALDQAYAPHAAAPGTTFGRREGEFLEALDTLVHSPEAHPLARASALQIAVRRRRPDLADLARSIAGDVGQPPALRASALAALGQVGDAAADRELLEHHATLHHLQISSASKSALARLLD